MDITSRKGKEELKKFGKKRLQLKDAANQPGQQRIGSRTSSESNIPMQIGVCIAVADSSVTKTGSEQIQKCSIECQGSDTDSSGEQMDDYTSEAHVAVPTNVLRTEIGTTLYEDELTMEQSQEYREEAHNVGLPECVDAYFTKPTENERNSFFHYHPQQTLTKIPFNPEKAYKRGGFSCHWLTYSESKEALFCSVCLAFSKPSESNKFTLGTSTWKHVYQRIEKHESSQYHKQNTDAFLIHSSECDISFLLVRNATNIRKSQVIQKRKVMERIIDILMFIGKRGLSYRGNKAESAFLLDDPLIDHGNFLELLLLLSKYDEILRVHLDKVICESKKRHSSLCEGQKGRGSLITLISTTTLNYILEAIHQLQLDLIVQEVKKPGSIPFRSIQLKILQLQISVQ
ncbi:hypothetical protein LOD99_2256 [Oopsacas minuta]|uniref:TTF-type domain-containing protein n=1 Tax=Oopsacas minuta TaxID=111878 RepID=A0AAV7K552_9METZ|nr:hypothetical protein LOD99_2256 [Oopsacas minuta]